MKSKQEISAIITALKALYPDAQCSLDYGKDYELLFSVRLAAQCTDARVNLVTPALFARYPTLEAFAEADVDEVGQYIHSCGFYNGKARDIVACAQKLVNEYGGRVPGTMEELTGLPGVGRKTANVIRGNIYHVPSIVVDTHVKRISKKLGLTKEDDPEKVEYELMKALPKDHWILYNIQIITLGRTICKAPTPKCGECFLTEWCKDYQSRQKKESRKKK